MKTTVSIYDEKPEQFDSRDFIRRMEDLRGDLDALLYDMQEAETPEDKATATEALESWLGLTAGTMDVDAIESFTGSADDLKDWGRSDEAEELAAMEAFASEAEGYASDWTYGANFIREDAFEDYARELAEDIGGEGFRDAAWPCNHVDWSAAADELRQDYTEVDFDGTAYLVR